MPYESATTNNRLINGKIIVSMIGDVKGLDGLPDGKCDIRDIAFVAAHYGELEGDPNWDPVADINDDGKVDIRDIAAVAAHYGEIDP